MQLFLIIYFWMQDRFKTCTFFGSENFSVRTVQCYVFLKSKNKFRIRSLPRMNINAKCRGRL